MNLRFAGGLPTCHAIPAAHCAAAFWADVLGMLEIDKGDDFVVLSSGVDQATLRLVQLPAGTPVDHGTGGGRVAYSFPAADLKPLQVGVEKCRIFGTAAAAAAAQSPTRRHAHMPACLPACSRPCQCPPAG